MEFGRREKTILVEQLIIIFVVYALLFMSVSLVNREHSIAQGIFMYYTNWSNIVAAAVQLFFLVCLMKGKEIPRLLRILKLASTVMLTVTFLVVVTVLCPQGGWWILLDPKCMLFLHFIVPVLAVVDFLLLIDMKAPSRQDAVFQVVPSLIYIIGVVIVLVVAGNDDLAPYPFLKIHQQSVLASALWIAALGVLISVVSLGYSWLFPKTNPSAADARELCEVR